MCYGNSIYATIIFLCYKVYFLDDMSCWYPKADALRIKISFFLQLLSAVNCWLKCMILDPYNQTDHPECKSRPDSGLSAMTELDPGYITGKSWSLH